jgi:hypothetical protein
MKPDGDPKQISRESPDFRSTAVLVRLRGEAAKWPRAAPEIRRKKTQIVIQIPMRLSLGRSNGRKLQNRAKCGMISTPMT